MTQANNKSIAVGILLGLITTFATGCYYYDRDDNWRNSRYRDGRYDSRYDRDRDRLIVIAVPTFKNTRGSFELRAPRSTLFSRLTPLWISGTRVNQQLLIPIQTSTKYERRLNA